MINELDTKKIRTVLEDKGMSVTALARDTGLSRQAIHHLLKPGYRPMPESVTRVADALGLELAEMLMSNDGNVQSRELFANLVRKARKGNARAFELLPAHLSRDPGLGRSLEDEDATTHVLLAAAAAVAAQLRPGRQIEAAVSYHSERAGSGTSYLFESKFEPVEAVINRTPEPMRTQLVFGAFKIEDFGRHMVWN